MASGSSVTADGMTTMTQVEVGDTIDDADFNNARTNVQDLMGGAVDATLSAGSAFISNCTWLGTRWCRCYYSPAGEVVDASSANGFKDLQDDVQAMCAFLGVSVRTGVGTDVTSSTTITAATWSNLMLNIQDCWNSRFSPNSRTSSTDDSVTFGSSWTNSLAQETTWTFASEGAVDILTVVAME